MTEEAIFSEALEIPEGERIAFLERACAGDGDLQRHIASLLNAHVRAGAFLEPLVAPPPDLQPESTQSGIHAETRVEPVTGKGEQIDQYLLLDILGEGGMGTVYRAAQLEPIKRTVALKVIRLGMASKDVLARFNGERQALARMDHPNIAKVHDGGTVGTGQPLFVMELVDGPPVTKYCESHGLAIDERLKVFIEICLAVQHAHQKGIIHRDLKPSNVLVTEVDGRPVPKVIDFGVAKAIRDPLADHSALTEIGMVVGTRDYMSPEMADLGIQDIDTRSDIYALGAVLYELLVGDTPFGRDRFKNLPVLEALRVIRQEEPVPPSTRKPLPGELDWIVLKALDKDRTRRYSTAADLARDLQHYLADEPVEAGRPSRGYRMRKFVRRNYAAVAVAAGIVVLMTAATAVSAGLAWWANRERIRATFAEAAATELSSREHAARTQSDARLGEIAKVNQVLKDVFKDLNPRSAEGGDESVRVALAKRLSEAADQISETAVGDPVMVTDLQNHLGVTLTNLGQYEKAIKVLTKATEVAEANFGADHRETLVCRANLALALYESGASAKGLTMLEDVLERRRKALGANDHETETTLSNLASIYRTVGRIDDAIAIHEQLLAARTKTLGPAHHNSIVSRHSLALAYSDAGRKEQALRMHEQNYQLCLATLGSNHKDTLSSRASMAACLLNELRHAEAKAICEEVLAARIANLGPDHPDTLSTRSSLADCFRAAMQHEAAIEVHEEILIIRTRVLGPTHPDTLKSRSNLGRAYREVKRFHEAIAQHEEGLRLRKIVSGEDHPATLASYNDLAVSYRMAGRVAESIPIYEATLGSRKRVLGPEHPDTLASMGNLTTAYLSDKRWVDAERVQRELINIRRRALKPDDPTLIDSIAKLGLTLIALKKYDEAEVCYREVLTQRENRNPTAWDTADARERLGESLLGQKGKVAEGEQTILRAYDEMKKAKPDDQAIHQPRIKETERIIMKLYDALRKKEEAEKWRGKLDSPKSERPEASKDGSEKQRSKDQ